MKVDRNQLSQAITRVSQFSKTGERVRYESAGGIPLRLDLAVRILSGWESSGQMIQALDGVLKNEGMPDGAMGRSLLALEAADTLIQAHNQTSGVEMTPLARAVQKAVSDLSTLRDRLDEGESSRSLSLDVALSDIEHDLEVALGEK